MKALTISNQSVTKQALLEMAQQDPTTWLGIRLAAGLLVLEGWNSSQIAEIFGLSRWSVVQWIQRLNKEGVIGLMEKERCGRPVRMNMKVQKHLEQALMKDAREVGLSRNHWDGITVVEYLKREHGVQLKVRQAQRWIRRLGFSLHRPIYRYAQATSDGVETFTEGIKKTPKTSKDKKR
jgi:transposase